MPFLRTIASLAYLGFFMISSIFTLPYEYFLRKKDPKKAMEMSQGVITWGLKCLNVLCGAKTIILGRDNIPKNEPVVFIGNHRSFYDSIVGYPHLPFHTAIIVKDGMRKVPAIGAWMERMHCLFLKRDDMRSGLDVIVTGIKYVNEGSNVMVFPEGTRNKGEGIGPFHTGSFKLATKPGVKIVPIVQTNTREIFETQWPWLKAQHTTMEYLEPIETKGLSREEIIALPDKVHDIMLEAYERNKKRFHHNK